MLSHSAHVPHFKVGGASASFKAFYAKAKGLRKLDPDYDHQELTPTPSEREFILSVLRANPSLRDAKAYIASFGIKPKPVPQKQQPTQKQSTQEKSVIGIPQTATATEQKTEFVLQAQTSPIIASILDPVCQRTALVKLQGPFTDRQLDSITRGLIYLKKLGLVSVIVVENEDLTRGEDGDREEIVAETMRAVKSLERQGAKARPIVSPIARLGPMDENEVPKGYDIPEAHTFPSDLGLIRSAIQAGDIPVLAPLALDSFCRTVRIEANDVIGALARGMTEAAAESRSQTPQSSDGGHPEFSEEVDLTPLRLMVINREGGIPSYARFGLPHLLVNLTSEYSFISETFQDSWRETHPTALKNLLLARTCLAYMPPTSSAIFVNHRSPSSLIGNLITNKPAVSSSLPHALLQGDRRLTPHTPTLLRRGVDVRVVRTVQDIDRAKMTYLLEKSFGRVLDQEAFYKRLEYHLDFVIVAGDYAGAAIVTTEPLQNTDSTSEPSPDSHLPITYLDKFAVLPSHQGDGTVDFLWVALHDESYGLGHPFSVNPNGGKEGHGEGRDLVWRSRANNPVNKWYFERSTGYLRVGEWVLFWCDAEARLKIEEGRRGSAGLRFVEKWEEGRVQAWADVVMKIPSSWKK
ncbi:mitochondrial amino-acid acetyltransferase [Thelephora ganbajun]|uniref:Mitochondrial amino-acid acetyltransferase n=1 Tax=Thelephora ganbajun TaxID=370292 RepID=A0ACB6ZQZ7_THEGA|nr:mitochondrial amino-acid acetyltransferase [Thelephora ganbajun]